MSATQESFRCAFRGRFGPCSALLLFPVSPAKPRPFRLDHSQSSIGRFESKICERTAKSCVIASYVSYFPAKVRQGVYAPTPETIVIGSLTYSLSPRACGPFRLFVSYRRCVTIASFVSYQIGAKGYNGKRENRGSCRRQRRFSNNGMASP